MKAKAVKGWAVVNDNRIMHVALIEECAWEYIDNRILRYKGLTVVPILITPLPKRKKRQ